MIEKLLALPGKYCGATTHSPAAVQCRGCTITIISSTATGITLMLKKEPSERYKYDFFQKHPGKSFSVLRRMWKPKNELESDSYPIHSVPGCFRDWVIFATLSSLFCGCGEHCSKTTMKQHYLTNSY